MSVQTQPPIRTGLLDFLKNSTGSQFVIPVYQRNYTWTAGKEVKQYLQDLESILEGEYKNHFLGIIIYLDTPIDFSTREFSVIDGQQRLTTTFLILYAIRSVMRSEGAVDAVMNLEGQVLTNPFSANSRLKYKLKPLVTDDDVYQFIIQDKLEEITNRDSKIFKNYMYICDYIQELNKKFDYNQILLALNELYVVCIPLSKEDNAQKIFESINSTGMKLTASDLIRNFLLMDLESDLQDKYYEEYWLKLEYYVSDDARKLENYFRFFLAEKNKVLPNKNAIYKDFVHQWYKNSIEELGREGVFEDIIKYAKFFHEIYNKDVSEIDTALYGAIYEFRKILSDMPAPLLMGFYNLYYSNEIDAEQLSNLIYIVNTYLIRRSLCDIDTSSITRMFPPLLKDVLEECDGNYKDIENVFKKNLVFKNINNSMFVPDEIQLRDFVMNANMYKIKSTLRIFFDKLEHEDNPAPVRLDKLNIEHLMPQTPSKDWYKALEVNEEEYQRNVNRLGNLTLVAKIDNSKMQNKIWDYKNFILSNTSHLKINEEILKIEHWNIEAIEKRTHQLIKDINRLFPYPKTDSAILRVMPIKIESNGVLAQANFYIDNGDVEILEGSELYNFDNIENYAEVEEERQILLEEGIIFDNNGKLTFKRSYLLSSSIKSGSALSSAARLILHGSRNGWDYWKNNEGIVLREIEEIKEIYNIK